MLIRKLNVLLLIPVLVTSACQSTYRPKAAIPVATFSAPMIADLTSPMLIANYDAMPEGPAKVARRNQILWELIWLTDNSYASYETAFFSGQAYVGIVSDAVVLGTSMAGAVTGTAATKAILAAVSGGVVGLDASYQKNFFDQATRESIVQVMRASRLTVLAEIEAGMADCTSTIACPPAGATYTLEQGLLDVTSYYDAGTIVGALIAISNSTSQQSVAAKAQLRAIHGGRP